MMNKLQNTLPIIVGNWKSHKTIPEARAWVQEWNELANQSVLSKLEVVVAPPLVALDATGTALRAAPRLSSVQLAAQDVSSYPVGSYTGGSPAKILASLGIHYTLAGHSERRNYFHETSRDVAAKALYSIEAGITPIVCVDEPYFAEQLAQLDTALLEKIIWAYEPVSAIGSGHPQPASEVMPIVSAIKNQVGDALVLYGGSVDHSNIKEYLAVTDGVIVGGASLNVTEFNQLLTAAAV